MTPNYIIEEDCKLYHSSLKSVCDRYGENLYKKMKKDCDEYFLIKHRKETRGIGGIIYEDFKLEDSWDKTFDFVSKVGYV